MTFKEPVFLVPGPYELNDELARKTVALVKDHFRKKAETEALHAAAPALLAAAEELLASGDGYYCRSDRVIKRLAKAVANAKRAKGGG